MAKKIKIGVLGASGYTGSDLVRLAARHPNIEITLLTANSHAGKPMGKVFPHLAMLDLPDLTTIDDADWSSVDAVFCGLPHGTTQKITSQIFQKYDHVKIIDMSADFRLRDPQGYQNWYGLEHSAPEIQKQAVYGLTEHYREEIKLARLIACPGCYPTATLMALLPLAQAGLINVEELIIDAKSGVSGAGRGLKELALFCEAGEGMSPYGVGYHRHMAELEQEIGKASGQEILVNFTPHLVPMSRGELVTAHVKMSDGKTVDDIRGELEARYKDEPFIHVLEEGTLASTQKIRGSNHVVISINADRIPGRAIIITALDNLVKGSAGQALQNFNLAFGLDETLGLEQLPLFP